MFFSHGKAKTVTATAFSHAILCWISTFFFIAKIVLLPLRAKLPTFTKKFYLYNYINFVLNYTYMHYYPCMYMHMCIWITKFSNKNMFKHVYYYKNSKFIVLNYMYMHLIHARICLQVWIKEFPNKNMLSAHLQL